MPFCSECGEDYPNTRKFCPFCGTPNDFISKDNNSEWRGRPSLNLMQNGEKRIYIGGFNINMLNNYVSYLKWQSKRRKIGVIKC